MRKTILAALIGGLAFGANAANLDDLRIGGFGSVGVGISDNDAGYAGYDKELGYKQDTLFGLQFDFQINDRASVTTQVVANGRYNFEPAFEVAYLSYKFDAATVRGGKIRTPFFMYSDYLDVGYAYPMLRPSQEIYEHLIISNFTGIDAIIPVEIGSSTLELQPFMGVSQLEERDSNFGQQADIKDVFGLAANWYINDWTVRGSYAQATVEAMSPVLPDSMSAMDPIVTMKLNQDQDATFTSIGVQYNDGTWLFNAEGMAMELSGPYYDVEAASVLLGYQVNAFTPYVAGGYISTSDNDERALWPSSIKEYDRTSYSVGLRWDFATNMAMKLDTTYVDYNDTTGGIGGNSALEYDDSLVYSASVDFVF
ncbi:hypothetical protein D1115_10740 [Vibrio alfacsensis]|uniref:Porin n=1 Tax=Vibrio alfacsensis TaxID=1074311 RepID=A0ABM6YWX4_9VIBR|nr:hypothetical protein [Vibrio alfacsensis]AXY02398.1 hypothetical protein D1115_10740 [Vibrio alfacsensis]